MSKGLKVWMTRSRFLRAFFACIAAVLIAAIVAPEKWVSEDGSRIQVSPGLMFLAEIAAVLGSAALLVAVGYWKRRLLGRVCKWMFSWRMIRRYLYGLACFTLLVVLFYAEEDWRGKHDWEQYKRTWEAKGERFDFASFVPPPVPDDQNFALTPIVSNSCCPLWDRMENDVATANTNGARRLDIRIYGRFDWKPWPTNDFQGNWQFGKKADLKVFQTYYRDPVSTNGPDKPLDPSIPVDPRYAEMLSGSINMGRPTGHPDATNEFPVAPQPQSPAADVLIALSKYDAEVEELRQASRLPFSRFPLYHDIAPTNKVRTLNWTPLTDCAQFLRLRAMAELEDGQNEKALDDVKLILYLASSVREEPFIQQHLWHISMIDFALQPLWQGMVDRRWPDSHLAAIEGELAKFDFLSNYQVSVRAQCAWTIEWVDSLERERSLHQYCVEVFSGAPNEDMDLWHRFVSAGKSYFVPKGWFYQNDIAVAQIFQKSLRTEADVGRRIFDREVAGRGEEAMRVRIAHPSPYNFLAGERGFDFSRYAPPFAFAQSSLDRARVACGLERYRLAHGELPATLEALSPQFIDKLPHDIINGQPLHYQRKEDGHFLLYSVGWNGTDDGGIVVRNKNPFRAVLDMEKGDWVWPDSAK